MQNLINYSTEHWLKYDSSCRPPLKAAFIGLGLTYCFNNDQYKGHTQGESMEQTTGTRSGRLEAFLSQVKLNLIISDGKTATGADKTRVFSEDKAQMNVVPLDSGPLPPETNGVCSVWSGEGAGGGGRTRRRRRSGKVQVLPLRASLEPGTCLLHGV